MKRTTILALFLMVLVAASASAGQIGTRLERAITAADDGPRKDDGTYPVWVYFTDKDVKDVPAALSAARAKISTRAIARRERVLGSGQSAIDMRDVPVAAGHVAAVVATGARERRQSRWLNAASFDATAEQIAAIEAMPFVKKVDLVARFVREEIAPDPDALAEVEARARQAAEKSGNSWTLDYGASLPTMEQLNVPPVHELGLSGHGIIVGQLDAGFRLTNFTLTHIPVLAQYDFVNDDSVVTPEPGDFEFQHRHGSQVLSTYAGFSSGNLIGPAYGVSVILAMTEDVEFETAIEEDNWVAGLEWVESLGADLVTSSLGYYSWYAFEDMDGNTAVTTIAGDMAVGRGMPVFSSAGNERDNPSFPHILAPADGDSVLAMAAVDLDGNVASFSSPGPTFDGRIKPDLAAHGVNVPVASYEADNALTVASGTSFACPLVAGVAALMLERVPGLTPMQVAEALRETASHPAARDNDTGSGIVNAFAAVTYWGALIQHVTLADTEDNTGPYVVNATITSRTGLDTEQLYLYWRANGSAWTRTNLTATGGDVYSAGIPGLAGGGLVEYYLAATDNLGFTVDGPHNGIQNPWSFAVGNDAEAPSLSHQALIDQVPALWPAVVTARATDNLAVDRVDLVFSLNGGPQQGPFALNQIGDRYELEFPLAAGAITVGDIIQYTLTACDSAAVPNTAVSGPWQVHILETRGRVLIIDDTVFASAAEKDVSTAGTIRAQWLQEAGYTTTTILPASVSGESLLGYDAVYLTSDDNLYPVRYATMRDLLVNYVNQGHPILVEGGGIADVIFSNFQDTAFAATVLRSDRYTGSGIGSLTPLAGTGLDPILVRPHALGIPFEQDVSSNPYLSSTSGAVDPTAGARAVLRSIYWPSAIGLVTYDDNTAPEGGQVVFISLALSYVDPAQARAMVENAMSYLLTRESPGEASISGTVTLIGSGDASGVAISCAGGFSTVTGPGGQYSLTGLPGSTYSVTASREGYASASAAVELGATGQATGVNLVLYPITEVNQVATPAAGIPDFNPTGRTSVINVPNAGVVSGLDVAINITHPSRGHLTVTLTSPTGTTVYLHNHTGGTADNIIGNWPATLLVDGPGTLADFLQEPAQGDWTLHVADTQFGAVGTFQSWGLNLLVRATPVAAAGDGLFTTTRLVSNVPNPFNPQTTVNFELASPGPVVLAVYDVRGSRVIELLRESLPAGRHQVIWNGLDDQGHAVGSGLYFCRLQAGGRQEMMKMMLVR